MNTKSIIAIVASPFLSVTMMHAASACAPYGLIGAKYAEVESDLGPCLDNETDDGAGGRIEAFQGGYIDWDGKSSQAFSVHGLVGLKYAALGLAVGYGHPVTDELPSSAENGGRYNLFSNGGSIIWHSGASVAYEVHGDIRTAYNNEGDEYGLLGFPTSDEIDTTSNGVSQAVNDFQYGQIYWFGGDRSTVLHVYDKEFQYSIPSIASANVASTQPTVATLYSNGNWAFSGTFENTSFEGLVPENMNLVVAIDGALGTVFAFEHSGVNGFNQSGTNATLQAQWGDLESGWQVKWNESSSIDLGTILSTIEKGFEFAPKAVAILSSL